MIQIVKKIFLVFVFVFGFSLSGKSQNIPKGFELLTVIEHPDHLILPAVCEIFIDTKLNILVVSYLDVPQLIDIYDLVTWSRIGRLEIHETVLDYSFIDYKTQDLYLIRSETTYMKYNLNTKFISKHRVKNRAEMPPQFFKHKYVEPVDQYFGDTKVTILKDWYYIKNDTQKAEIYVKPSK